MANVLPLPGTCAYYPAVPGRPARLDSYRYDPDMGWNAGANSVKSLTGNVRLVFTQGPAQGVAMGFTHTRENPTNYARLTHGFMFRTNSIGEPTFQIMESGRGILEPVRYNPNFQFAIYRTNGQVVYRVTDGSDVVMTYYSSKPSEGEVLVGCSLYASGDAVESEESP